MSREPTTNREKLANDIWRACDIMRRDNNCGGIMDYLEHLAWVLFLKFLNEQEQAFEQEAAISDRQYEYIIDRKYRWSEWVPKAIGEKVWITDRRAAPEWDGETLMRFVRGELLPYLSQLHGSSQREVIAGIFSSDRNIVVCASPYNLKDVLEIVDNIDFLNTDDIHTVSHVYEGLLQKLGNENKMAGEFYTPRPVIRFMVKVIDPQIDETIYDPACGSCGFLVETFEHLLSYEQGTRDHQKLQESTLFGNEKKALPALLGTMNLILHGVMLPRIHRRNTLEENIRDISDRFDVILTNPPFGGTENMQIQQNFPVRSNATELLFLEHIMKKLKPHDGARSGVVVPEGTLFRSNAFAAVKEELLTNFKLFMVVSLPPGTFAPYSDVKTALLFFERPGPTTEVLYHELALPKSLKKFSKGSPIADEHFIDAHRQWQRWKAYLNGKGPKPEPTEVSWIEKVEDLAGREYDLTARNPNRPGMEQFFHPAELTATLLERSREYQNIIERLHEMVSNGETV
jgi:type I restriction enzyme M protein